MTVSTIASVASGLTRTLGEQNAKVATSVRSLVSRSSSAASDVSSLNVANSLQTQIATLRSATQNVAQASSMARVAEGGVSEIGRAVGRLQELSARASNGSLSDADRRQLDIEFQSLRATINRIAVNTRFAGQNLLDGSLTSQTLNMTAEGEEGFAIGSLTDKALFGTGDVNLLSAENATAAAAKVATAQQYVSTQQATLGAIDQGLEFAFASLETAGLNQEAARAVLSDADFADFATQSQQARVQAEATTALLAQTNKLPGNILGLLGE